jgi:hypothetical protein
MPGRYWLLASSRVLRPDCGTPNGGWIGVNAQKFHRLRLVLSKAEGWSSWTKRHFAFCLL